MYKRDRARKLQVLRQRQVLTTSGSIGSGSSSGQAGVSLSYSGGLSSSSSNNPMYTSPLHIKQEIQIPQVTSMTSSPDSSPSPGQLPGQSSSSSGGVSGQMQPAGANSASGNQVMAQQTDPNSGGVQWPINASPQGKVRQTFARLKANNDV